MSAPSPDRTDPSSRGAGSPAVAITAASGVVGLLLALNPTAFAVSLFFCAVALAALPLALADRPGARPLRFAVVGGACALLGLVLVLGPLLGGSEQREERLRDPVFTGEETPSTPGPARDRSAPPSSPGP